MSIQFINHDIWQMIFLCDVFLWWKPLHVDQKSIVMLSYVHKWKYMSVD